MGDHKQSEITAKLRLMLHSQLEKAFVFYTVSKRKSSVQTDIPERLTIVKIYLRFGFGTIWKDKFQFLII